MMQAIKLPFVPNTVTSHCNSWFTIDGVDTILISDQDTNNVFWIVSEEEVQEQTLVAKESPHKRPIRSIVYSYKYECFISCDEKGLVEYWHPKSLQLPLGLEFKIKSQTDMFKLIKTKTIPNNILISQNSEYFIVQSDKMIHRFCFKTGKIVQTIQEEHISSAYLDGNSILYSTKEEILAYDFIQQQEIANYGTNDNVKYNFVALASETQTTPISSEMITSKNSLVNSKLNKQQLLVATTANKLMVFDSEDKPHGNAGKTKQPKVTLHTTFGDIKLELFDKLAPKTAENFITLCKRKYYNNVIFHRVIKSFMIQTGDPKGDGTGGESCWGGHFPDEFNNQLNHKQPFMVSMANAGPNTNGSQFFITTDEASFLDNKHTVFGKVISGIDTVKQIEDAETDENDKPIEQIAIISTTLEI
ncbi:uncharacterized protein SPAPADRAFT_61670 [Spathaspora passalidarum NRRL Y-27907]|uniref:peptidylprolyl isomerase n=1 Tax=Spathaspora passalidarum (strain NRRL Y-27907 / 11-Y1) TaxID=619300 RepID=G3ANY2_SPAPN|nr:uncharacterized protein SPAPADRAFT_61670 [Spathaspora passalidarum NRRL Y-27907]EGW32606.1 hypothetical protein SPAPADRAFT_61670 [Spathaspora passalidarum NRRL Y-27907]